MAYVEITFFSDECNEFVELVEFAKCHGFVFKSKHNLSSVYDRVSECHKSNIIEHKKRLDIADIQSKCHHDIRFYSDGVTLCGGTNKCSKCGWIESHENGR